MRERGGDREKERGGREREMMNRTGMIEGGGGGRERERGEKERGCE